MKDKIKKLLTIEDVYSLVEYLGGEPLPIKGNSFISKTICHHDKDDLEDASYKLYYYQNDEEGIFHCYTACADSFDIFELVSKVEGLSLYQSILFVNSFFNNLIEIDEEVKNDKIDDWEYLNKKENRKDKKKIDVKLKIFDDAIIKNLPTPIVKLWNDEGISQDVIKLMNIKYNPVTDAIVIPHYDKDGKLIGIRERTVITDNEKFGKYRPSIFNKQQYNHPLGYSLYGLNMAKENIALGARVVVFESEKAVLKCLADFLPRNCIYVASCGSSISNYQMQLLINAGAEEVIIAFDKQWKEKGDPEFQRWTKKLKAIHQKFNKYVKISFIFDKNDLLDYKMSPIDKDKETFKKLYMERITLD